MINICYTAQSRVFNQLLVSIISLCKHTREEIHIFNMDCEISEYNSNIKKLTKKQVELIQSIVRSQNSQSIFTNLDITNVVRDKLMNTPNTDTTKYIIYSCNRLLFSFISEFNNVDRIIWLDPDTIINDDINKIWQFDLQKKEVAGCKEHLFKRWWGPFIGKYINTGVMLMDLKLCRENHTFEKMIDLLHMRKMTYIDGDAINIVATIQHFPKNFVVMGTKNIKNSIIHHTCYVSKNYLLSVFNWRKSRIKNDNVMEMRKRFPYYNDIYDQYDLWLDKLL